MQQETLPHGANGGERTADAQELLSLQPLQLSSQAGKLHNQRREAVLRTSLQAIFHSQRQLWRRLWSWKMVQVCFTCLSGKQWGVHKWRPGSHWHPRPASDSVAAATPAFQPLSAAAVRRRCRHFIVPWFSRFPLALRTQHAQCKINSLSSLFFLVYPLTSCSFYIAAWACLSGDHRFLFHREVLLIGAGVLEHLCPTSQSRCTSKQKQVVHVEKHENKLKRL